MRKPKPPSPPPRWLTRLWRDGHLWQCGGVVLVASLTTLSALPAAAADQPPERRFAQALAMVARHQDEQAMAAFEQLAREYPDRPEPLVNLGVLMARHGRLNEARQALERALRTSPPHALAYDNLVTMHTNLARRAYASAMAPGSIPQAPDGLLQWSATWAGGPGGQDTPAALAEAANAAALSASGTPQVPAPSLAAASASPLPAPAPASAPATPPVDVAAAATAPAALSMKFDRSSLLRPLIAALVLMALGATAWALSRRPVVPDGAASGDTAAESAPTASDPLGAPSVPPNGLPPAVVPEERLIRIYRLIGAGQMRDALVQAESLVQDAPRFQLAQLVYGDLLLAHTGSLKGVGRGTAQVPNRADGQVGRLQQEAQMRLKAWMDPPPAGTIPQQILQLPSSVRHVLAVDGLRSRVYVLEHRAGNLVPVANFYAAIGKLGVGKRDEGDMRTPLGIYDITGRLETRQIGDFYGAGALPLSYPNEHDRRMQRTGANIWLHGTPSTRYADAPRSSNGCVVLANDDMHRLMLELAPRRTPVIVAERLEWVSPKALAQQRLQAQNLIEVWRTARMKGDLQQLLALYARRFDNGETGLAGWRDRLAQELTATAGRDRQLADLSIFAWNEQDETLMISFREVLRGSATGPLRQQYWARESGQWRIFSEGVMQ